MARKKDFAPVAVEIVTTPRQSQALAKRFAAREPMSSKAPELHAKPGSWHNPRERARDDQLVYGTTVYIPKELGQQVDRHRLETRRRFSDIVTEALAEWLAKRGAE